MKRLLLLAFVLVSMAAAGQNMRNTILGIYTGTYLNYSSFQVLPSASKVVALPNDDTGLIINDTLNNIIDTFYVCVDTFLCNSNTGPCGYYLPSVDSILYSRCNGFGGNPTAEFDIKCISHTFPTAIKESPAITVDIYPNPAENMLSVQSASTIKKYILYNSFGLVIKDEVVGTENVTLCLDKINQGVYFIKLITNKGDVIRRFIKV